MARKFGGHPPRQHQAYLVNPDIMSIFVTNQYFKSILGLHLAKKVDRMFSLGIQLDNYMYFFGLVIISTTDMTLDYLKGSLQETL